MRRADLWRIGLKLPKDPFGRSVSVSGDLIAVGTPFPPSTAFDGAADDEFGKAVAVDDDGFIVGAWLANVTDRTGAAYVFRRRDDGNGWSLSVKPIPDDGGYGDGFGFAVDIDDGCAAVGAPNRDGPGGSFDGATYVTCTLPGIGAETPQLDIDIICCEAPLDPRGPVTYEVRLETDLDRQTVARYRVRLHGPDGESIDLQDREIDYVPGRKPQRDRGEFSLTERSKPGLYTLSVYVTDETGQTHIEHERFEHSGRRR